MIERLTGVIRPYAWGSLTAAIALVTGALYFRNRERLFADVA